MADELSKSDVTELPKLGAGPHRRRLGLVSVIACFGGLLFGYDTGVTNGAEGPMQEELGLSLMQLGVVISALVFAAAFGALFFGRMSDFIGRRRTIVTLAIVFFIGTLVVVFSPGGPEYGSHTTFGFSMLIFGRILLGLAVGGSSTVVPVYLAEMSPQEIRGSFTGRNELVIIVGQLAAFVVNAIIGTALGDRMDGVWRIMFAVCAVPSIVLFFGMLRMPESPRWYVNKGKLNAAYAVLRTIRAPKRAEAELKEVERTVEQSAAQDHTGLRAVLRNRWLLRTVLVGVGLAMSAQLTGINSVMFYGQRILVEAGFSGNAAMFANIAAGFASLVGAFIALRNMDRLDRRTTFILGLVLVTIFHMLIGIASQTLPESNIYRSYILLVLIVGFVLSMQAFLNIAVFVWLAEIFPVEMRGLGIGIALLFSWITNGTVSLFVPSLIGSIGITGTFFSFAAVCALALLFVYMAVPETRGQTLEELETAVKTGGVYRGITRRQKKWT